MRQLIERQALIENRAIVAERNVEEIRNKYDSEISERQNEIIHMTTENKRLEVLSHSLENAKQQLNQSLTESQTELKDVSERYSGLQILWEETLKRAQDAEEQIQSLKKINQELSLNLREKRINYDKVKEQLALLETQSSQKLKALMDSLKSRDLQFSEEARRDLPPIPDFEESQG
jgi:chromosome segregation ATPase